MQTPMRRSHPTSHDEIAAAALLFWEGAGRPTGRDLEFWLSAEQRVIAAHEAQSDNLGISTTGTKALSANALDPWTEPSGTLRARLWGTDGSQKTTGKKSISEHTTRLGRVMIPVADPKENKLAEGLPGPKARQETLMKAALTLAAALELNEFLNRLETSFGWVAPVEPTERPAAGLQAHQAASTMYRTTE